MDAQVLGMPDGRELAYSDLGPPDGFPVFGFHGTPGSRRQVVLDERPLVATGVRCIAPDRPGYGLSTFHPGRTFEGWAADVRALADHLGIARFGVFGISGGGPHAAACARFLADRVTAAAIVSGVGPLSERGSEAGMMPVNRMFARVARRAPKVNRVPFGLLTGMSRRFPDRVLANTARVMPPPDAAVASRPEVAAALREDFVHTSATAGRAAAQDFGLIAADWGFRLEDLAVPVDVWQADSDVNVPLAHAHAQAERIPGAELHLFPGEGHLMVVDHLEEILRTLLVRGGPTPGS